ncbi:MAG TPA: hypothetical protein VGV89_02065 [Thermoplasmata archaeon]|nr:hypothetical protein [Thermoplasmata archaeon]
MTLFGTIFVFVNTFPRPTPQANGQFSASLQFMNLTGYGTVISVVNIAHLAGPTLYNGPGTQVWINSAANPNAFPTSYGVSSGFAASSAWAIGQTWSLNISSKHLTTPDNLTISIVQANQLLFRQVVPGANLNIPPQFTNEGTVPAIPIAGTSFAIFVQIVDQYLPSSSTNVLVNYSLLPDFSSAAPHRMTYQAGNGSWQFIVPISSPPVSGTYYVFVTATDTNGLRNTIAVPVTLQPTPTQLPGPVQVQLLLNQTAAVNNTASSIIAVVTDEGQVGGAVTVQYFVNGVLVASKTGAVTSGSSTSLSAGWTPRTVGTVTILGEVTVSGVGSANATLTLTIFPAILLVQHNAAFSSGTKTFGAADEGGWLATALMADGIPFQTTSVSCKSSLPTSASSTYNTYTVVIVDFGSSTAPGCAPISAADQTTMANLAANRSVWAVGANVWSASACPSTAFLTAFGLKTTGSSCGTTVALPVTTGVYTANAGNGFRADGVPASLTVNKTVAGNATFTAFTLASALASGETATSFFTVGGATAGTFVSSGGVRKVVLAFDPSMLVATLPGGQSQGTGGAAAEVAYNIVDYLSGITSSATTNANRQGADFAVSEVSLIGYSHTAPTTIDAMVRDNGLTGGVVTVTLYVNGTPALYGGVVVTETQYLNGGGTSIFVPLTWRASGGGPYALTVVITGPNDSDPINNEFGTGILPIPTTFS